MAHVMLDNRYSDNETSDPMSMFVDSMSRSGLNTYPFWGEVAQAVTTDAEGGDFFKARWHPLDWTAESRLLLTYGVMRKVPPELWGQWIGPSSVTSTPFAAYYVGRTLTNMLQEGRISDSMAGAAMAYLDHAANGRPLPPEWESLNKQAVYDVLKQAQDIAFKVASVQQATSLISGIPLNAFNKAELETMRSQREQGSLYYDTEQKQDTQMNPYGSNLAVEAYRGFNPMADQRSLQSGILNQPQPGKSIGEKWAKSAMYDAVEPRIQEMQAAMSQYGTAFAQKGADKNDIYAARKEAAVNYAKQVLGEDAVAAWVEANGGSDNVRDNVSEGEVVAFVRDSLQAQFPSYVPWEQRPENNPALAGGPMPTAQPWQVSPFQQPSMVPPGQFPPGAPMQAGLGEAPSTQPVAPTAPPTMQAGAIQNVPSDMNPAEARYNAMQQAVQDVFYMQGRPDYASFVNETSKNYDAYYAAQDRFRAQQVQELARRTGISPQEANQMLDAYQGRNLSPTEQGRFAQIDQQSAVDDEHWAAYNAFGDDTVGRAQYLMDNPDFAEGAYRDYKLGKKGQTGPDGKIDDGNWEWYKSYVEGGGGGRFPPGAWKKMTAEQQQEAMTRFGSDINELNRQYGALPKGSQERKDFLKAHPQLIELWKYETEIGVLEARADTRDYQPRQRSASYSNIYSGPRRGGGGSWSGAQAMLQGGGAVGGAGVGPQVQGMPFVSNYADRPFQSNRRAPTPWELRTNDLLIRPEDLARSEQQLSPMNPQLWNIYTRLMMNTRR